MLPTNEEFEILKNLCAEINALPDYKCTLLMKGNFKTQNVVVRIRSPRQNWLTNITNDNNHHLIKMIKHYIKSQHKLISCSGIAHAMLKKCIAFKNINMKGI